MIRLVVDASVVVKWYPPYDQEPLASQAHALMDRWVAGEVAFAVPDLIWPEVANILWKSVRRNRCSLDDAEAALAHMLEQNLSTIPSAPLIDQAFHIAVQYGRTAYDSLYVALALASNSLLVTADEKLANTLGGHLPVKWLGAI